MAVQAVGRTPDLEAPLSIRLGSDSSTATASSSTFGSYSGGHLDREQQQQQQLWLEEHRRRDGRPAYASESTDLSTLLVTDSRQREEFDNEEDFTASANSESTLSADENDDDRVAEEVGDAAGDNGLLPGYATGWDGVVNGNLGSMLSGPTERHHLIETDRTSVSSSDDWADCEYELIAAQRVNDLFEQIDSLLYRQEPFASPAQPPPAVTLEECAEWRSAFPHLRLRGSQLAAPREPGFSHRPAPAPLPPTSDEATPRPADDQAATDLTDAGLQIIGRALAVRRPSVDDLQPAAADLEELLAQEGCVEEAIAIDDGAAGDEPQRPAPRRSRSVAPQQPVTPSLALRDAAQCAAFDSLWARLVAWSRPLFLERVRRSRRFSQQPQRGGARDDDEDDETVSDEEDEPAGPLHRIGPGFQQRHSRQAASAAGVAVDPRLPSDLAGLLSISSKTLQQRSELPLQLATVAPSATASVSGFGRRPPGRLVPVDRPKTPQQQQRYGGQHLQQPLLHHQQPQLPLHPQHHPQHAGLFAAFTRSGTLPPLHDRRGPLQAQQASQPHHPLLRAGAAASVRPGSGGRPGVYSSLDWPTPSAGAHFGGGGRAGGPRANSGLHHRHRGIHGIHGRALAATGASVAPAELDALYEAAPAMRTANSLHLGPATSSYQQIKRSRLVGLIRK